MFSRLAQANSGILRRTAVFGRTGPRLALAWGCVGLGLACSSEVGKAGTSGAVETAGTGASKGGTQSTAAAAAPGVVVAPDSSETVVKGGAIPAHAGASDAGSCAHASYEAERVGVNIYLLVDVSGSMRSPIDFDANGLPVSRWDAVRKALESFARSPKSEGLDVGMNFFPVHTPRSTCASANAMCPGNVACLTHVCDVTLGIGNITKPCTESAADSADECKEDGLVLDGRPYAEKCRAPGFCSGEATRVCFNDDNCRAGQTCKTGFTGVCPGLMSCKAADYSTPVVPKSTLPAGAPALLQALASVDPDSFSGTPTHVALSGAFVSVAQWQKADPTRKSVLVLATDGYPEGCTDGSALMSTVDVLSDGKDSGIQSFVIGVLDPKNPNLKPGETDSSTEASRQLSLMSEAGGAGEPTLISADNTTADQFLKALDMIRGAVLPCEYKIPPGQGAVLDKLNVEVVQQGASRTIPKASSQAACGKSEAWYYDTDATGGNMTSAPSKVVLCPAACEALSLDGSAKVDIALGCQTVYIF